MAAEATHHYGQIYMGSRGAVSQGQLRIQPGGFQWKRSSGGKTVDVKREDIDGLTWMKSSRGCQLGVKQKSGPAINFVGFREKDLETLREFASKQLNIDIVNQEMALQGHNWGGVSILNGSLVFTVGGKPLFEVPLKDVAQAQQAKDDVVMELHVDDTAGNDREDMLCEMAFTVPPAAADFPAQGEDAAAKVMLDHVLQHLDAGATSTDEAVCIFGDVAVLAPRGRFEVLMHLNHLAMFGQTQEFKIRYTSIQRIFILPKSNTPHTLVVISLDPPIRKGQTYYTHLLCQFPSEEETNVELDITPEVLAAKNAQFNGKLEEKLTGAVHEVFARALRGLSGAKITRPGAFKNSAADGNSIRCSYKADDGHLYPLDRAFFYVHKPPMMLPFDEVESVEFARQGGGVVSSRTFDLVVRMRNNLEHQFRNINRTEWQNLFEFIKARKIRIENLAAAQQGPGGGRGLDIEDGDVDPGMRKAMAEAFEDEEDDEDFEAGTASESESISDSGSDDAEMVAEEGISLEAIGSKGAKKGGEGTPKAAEKKRKPEEGPGGEDKKKAKASPKEKKEKKEKKEDKGGDKEKGAKKEKKKKDPNAPKGALSAFMYFSNATRDAIKAENPGISFGDVGKLLGERWKALGPEAKEPFELKAKEDKERYAKAMAAYKAGNAAAAAAEGSDGGADDD